MKGMSWLCPHQLGELCERVKKICEPGMKGCVLNGRVEFVEPEKEAKGGKMREKIEKAIKKAVPEVKKVVAV